MIFFPFYPFGVSGFIKNASEALDIRLFFLAMPMTGQVRANRHHVFAQSLRHNSYFSLKLAIYS